MLPGLEWRGASAPLAESGSATDPDRPLELLLRWLGRQPTFAPERVPSRTHVLDST